MSSSSSTTGVTKVNAWAAQEQGGVIAPWTYEQPAELKPKEVEIEVEYCGVCHSDLSMLTGEFPWASYPFVGGHEVIGIVKACGSEVDKDKFMNKRVGLGWQRGGFCRSCRQCAVGDVNLCGSAVPTIAGENKGGFASHCRAEAQAIALIPDSVNPATAGPWLCGGVTMYTPLREFVKNSAATTVGVVGLGGLGSMGIQMAAKMGCEVVAFTSTAAKGEQAKQWGATKVVDSTSAKEIRSVQCDLIIVTVSVELDWAAYLDALSPRGRLHFVGVVQKPLAISLFSLLGGLKSVSASPCGSTVALDEMLAFIGRHKLEAQVEEFPIEKINECLDKVRDGSIRYRGVLKVKKN